jgi:hypothetical protein
MHRPTTGRTMIVLAVASPNGLTRGGTPWWGDAGDVVWIGPSHQAPAEAFVIEPPIGGGDPPSTFGAAGWLPCPAAAWELFERVA